MTANLTSSKFQTVMQVTSAGAFTQDYTYTGFANWTDKAEIIKIDASSMTSLANQTSFFACGWAGWRTSHHNFEIQYVPGTPAQVALAVVGETTESADVYWHAFSVSDWTKIEVIYSPIKGFYVNGTHAEVPSNILTAYNSITTATDYVWHGFGPDYGQTSGVVYDVGLYTMEPEDWPDYGGKNFLDLDGLTYFKGKLDVLFAAKQNTITNTTVTLTAAGWSGTSQAVEVTGMTTTKTVMVSAAPASLSEYASCQIFCQAQAAGALLFRCSTVPSNDLTVNLSFWD